MPQQGPENMYKFNGTEHITDFDLDWNHTLFRTYDNALGRWHQIDPKHSERESPFVGLANNPVIYSDLLGDTTHVFYTNGEYFMSFYGKDYSPEIHFVKEGTEFPSTDFVVESEFREKSLYYIGSDAMSELQHIANKSNNEGLERPFIFYYMEGSSEREICVMDITDTDLTTGRTANGVDLQVYGNSYKEGVDKILNELNDAVYIGGGHTHPKAGLKSIFRCGNNCNSHDNATNLNPPTNASDGPVDYTNHYEKNRLIRPSIIGTAHGITIYSTKWITTSEEYKKQV